MIKILFSFLLLIPPVLFAQNNNTNENIAKKIDSILLANYNLGIFNGSVLVAKEGEIIYKRAFGWSDFEKRDTLKITDPMRIASVTKTFTAVAILQLVEQGKINLHEDINTYIPEIERRGMTIHHLLSHTSGIAYINGGKHFIKITKEIRKNSDSEFGIRITNEDILAYFKNHQPEPRNKVGEKFFYSNVSYTILASLIEKVSGQKYADYLKQNIFSPLNMENTKLYLPEDLEINNTEKVKSYSIKKGKLKDGYLYYYYNNKGKLAFSNDTYGDKYILSTVEDLYKFNLALINNKLVTKKSFKLMTTPVSETKTKNYGYGIYNDNSISKNNHVHTGGIADFSALNYFEDNGNQIIFLTNVNSSSFFFLYHALVHLIHEEENKIKEIKRNKSEIEYEKLFEKQYKIKYEPLNL